MTTPRNEGPCEGSETAAPGKPALHVFEYYDNDLVIAADEAGALEGLIDHFGGEPHEYETGYWRRLADEQPMTLWCDADGDVVEVDADGGELIERTCAEWAAKIGPGYLASRES